MHKLPIVISIALTLTGVIPVFANENEVRHPIVIPGIKEPPEMLAMPLPRHFLSEAEAALAQVLNESRDQGKSYPSMDSLNRLVGQYPEFHFGYVIRLGYFCEGSDVAAALSDANNAIRTIGSSNVPAQSRLGLTSMRAKLLFVTGKQVEAIQELATAISMEPEDAFQFPNSGAIEPERKSTLCTWTESDMDTLVAKYVQPRQIVHPFVKQLRLG
jgi:hypothetical protein